MTMSSEWTLTLPFEGGSVQVSAKIPDMAAVSPDDAQFVDDIREQVLDRIHDMIVAKKRSEDEKAAEPAGGDGQ